MNRTNSAATDDIVREDHPTTSRQEIERSTPDAVNHNHPPQTPGPVPRNPSPLSIPYGFNIAPQFPNAFAPMTTLFHPNPTTNPGNSAANGPNFNTWQPPLVPLSVPIPLTHAIPFCGFFIGGQPYITHMMPAVQAPYSYPLANNPGPDANPIARNPTPQPSSSASRASQPISNNSSPSRRGSPIPRIPCASPQIGAGGSVSVVRHEKTQATSPNISTGQLTSQIGPIRREKNRGGEAAHPFLHSERPTTLHLLDPTEGGVNTNTNAGQGIPTVNRKIYPFRCPGDCPYSAPNEFKFENHLNKHPECRSNYLRFCHIEEPNVEKWEIVVIRPDGQRLYEGKREKMTPGVAVVRVKAPMEAEQLAQLKEIRNQIKKDKEEINRLKSSGLWNGQLPGDRDHWTHHWHWEENETV